MARKKGEEEPCGNWMDTYGDMVTLLLTFFVMLFSMSSVNEEKWANWVKAFMKTGNETDQVVLVPDGDGDSIGTNNGPPPEGDALANASMSENSLPKDFDELYEYLKSYVKEKNMENSVEISKANGAVMIRFQDNIFFNPDSSALKGESFTILDFLGDCLKSVEDQILTVNINGHTASVPNAQNYKVSDWKLSSERAANVAIYFEEKKLMDPTLLLPIGYGKNYPVASNDTDEGRKKNRRVDMLIISKDSEMSSEDILKSLLSGTFDASQYPESGGVADVLRPSDSASGSADNEAAASGPVQPAPVLPSPQGSGSATTGTTGNVTLGGEGTASTPVSG